MAVEENRMYERMDRAKLVLFIVGLVFVLSQFANPCYSERYPKIEILKTLTMPGDISGHWGYNEADVLKIDGNLLFYMPPRIRDSLNKPNGFEIIDISDPEKPEKVKVVRWNELGFDLVDERLNRFSLDMEWPFVYIPSYDGLYVLDFTDLDHPQNVSYLPYSELDESIGSDVSEAAIRVVDRTVLLYVEYQCYILDYSTLESPLLLSSVSLPVFDRSARFIARQIVWDGGAYAYLSPGLWTSRPYFYGNQHPAKTVRVMDYPEYPNIGVLDLSDLHNPVSTFIQIDNLGIVFPFRDRLYARVFDSEDTHLYEWIVFDANEPMNPIRLENRDAVEMRYNSILTQYPFLLDSSIWNGGIGIVPFDNELFNQVLFDYPDFLAEHATFLGYTYQTTLSADPWLRWTQLERTAGVNSFELYE